MEQDTKVVMQQMDEAAEAADEQLSKQLADNPALAAGAAAVAQWMKANYGKAGYKRLSKLLMLRA